MTMREYLSDRLGVIVLQAVFATAAAGFLGMTGTGSGMILLLVIFWLLAFLCVMVTGYIKCRARLRELENIMDGLDEKYLFAECISRGGSIYERRLLELFRKAGRAMVGAVSDARAAQQEYREYVESWVHEIKTPIAAAGLICHHADPVTRRKLSAELAQIESHVERALFYARAESPEKDFMIRRIRLSEMVEEAVERHRALLIRSGIRVDIQGTACISTGDIGESMESVVYTDDKWAVFILGQLLQNGARYRREESGGSAGENAPVIELSAKLPESTPANQPGKMPETGLPSGQRANAPVIELQAKQLGKQVQLVVRDNGIGIPAHELPRVFDRGFTGSNGRARGGSTGIGLYLCRRLADCLEIGLQIASKEGEGTVVTLTFPAENPGQR